MKNKNLFGLKILIITMLKLLNFVSLKITNASNKRENVKGKENKERINLFFFYIYILFLILLRMTFLNIIYYKEFGIFN